MSLTKEQEQKYIDHGGVICPYCLSTDITSGHIESDAAIAWAKVSCNCCDKQWQDLYTLTGIDSS